MRCSAIILFFAVSAFGQKLSYFEGDVAVNGQTQSKNDGAVFPAGTTLSTTGGRIELQLSPDVYVRIGNQSSLKILSNSTVQLLTGSAIIDAARANVVNAGMKVRDASVQIATPGEYEFSAAPPQLKVDRGEAEVSRGGEKTIVTKAAALGTTTQAAADQDTLLDIWSTNRRIRLSSRLTGSTQPEQPLIGPNTDVTAGISASVGLIPLTGLPQLMYEPIRPYRPGSPFFGPSYAYWYPYYSYPAQLRPPGPQRFRPFVQPTPSIGLRPGVSTFNGGLHIPGPVIGH